MDTFERYVPSGKPGLWPIPLVLGAAAALLLAWPYQALIDWVPLIYLNALATAGFGFVIGIALAFGLALGKCRSRALALALGLLCGALGVVATHVVAYDFMVDETLEEVPLTRAELTAELGVAEYLETRADYGWSVGRGEGFEVSGWMVWLVWLVEAVVICGIPAWFAQRAAGNPFCEDCGLWLEEHGVGAQHDVNKVALEGALHTGSRAAVLDPESLDGSGITATYTVHRCDECEGPSYLSINATWTVHDKKGKEEEESELILAHALLDDDELTALEDRFSGEPVSAAPQA